MKAVCVSVAFLMLGTACAGSRDQGPSEIQPDCTAEARAGIVVTTLDSISGQELPAIALVTAQDGSYTEQALVAPPRYYMAFERAGTYLVIVQLPGYQPWRDSNVSVQNDRCHVATVNLTARLVR